MDLEVVGDETELLLLTLEDVEAVDKVDSDICSQKMLTTKKLLNFINDRRDAFCLTSHLILLTNIRIYQI